MVKDINCVLICFRTYVERFSSKWRRMPLRCFPWPSHLTGLISKSLWCFLPNMNCLWYYIISWTPRNWSSRRAFCHFDECTNPSRGISTNILLSEICTFFPLSILDKIIASNATAFYPYEKKEKKCAWYIPLTSIVCLLIWNLIVLLIPLLLEVSALYWSFVYIFGLKSYNTWHFNINKLETLQVTAKFRCVVRLVAMFPWRPQDFQSPIGTYRIRLTLEDPTARIHAFLCADDAVKETASNFIFYGFVWFYIVFNRCT